MSFGMDEVTSKVAYAYAKQSAFVVVATALLAVTPTVLYLVLASVHVTWPVLVAVVGDLALLAGAAAILVVVFTRKDLHRINRLALRISGAIFLVQFACVLTDAVVGTGAVRHITSEAALAAFPLAAVVTYPFPIRRGGTVLYSPNAVRRLANARAAAMASLLLVLLASFRLLMQGGAVGLHETPVSPLVDARLFEALAILASGLFLILGSRPFVPRAIESVLVVILALALVLIAEDPHDATAWALALGPIGIVLSAIVVDFGLSRRLDAGRTIVAHRA